MNIFHGLKMAGKSLIDAYGKIGWLGLGVTFIAWLAFPGFMTGGILGFFTGFSAACIILPRK